MKIFWAWQSDTDGARHFIRDALAAAIKQLKQPEDIDDPAERDLKMNCISITTERVFQEAQIWRN